MGTWIVVALMGALLVVMVIGYGRLQKRCVRLERGLDDDEYPWSTKLGKRLDRRISLAQDCIDAVERRVESMRRAMWEDVKTAANRHTDKCVEEIENVLSLKQRAALEEERAVGPELRKVKEFREGVKRAAGST